MGAAQAVGGTQRFAVPRRTDDRDLRVAAGGKAPDILQNRSVPSAPIFLTKDGRLVVNRMDSHISGRACHFLRDAVAQIETGDREFIVEEIVFDEIIGHSLVIETTVKDDIWYGKRPRRQGWSRFVVGREPAPTKSMTVILKQRSEDLLNRTIDPTHAVGYVLITGYIGKPTIPEPEDIVRLDGIASTTPRNAIEQAAQAETTKRMTFWENHAFVLHTDPNKSTLVWPNTLTRDIPWRGKCRYRHERTGKGKGVVVTPFLMSSVKTTA